MPKNDKGYTWEKLRELIKALRVITYGTIVAVNTGSIVSTDDPIERQSDIETIKSTDIDLQTMISIIEHNEGIVEDCDMGIYQDMLETVTLANKTIPALSDKLMGITEEDV